MVINTIYIYGALALLVKVGAPIDHHPKKANQKLKLFKALVTHTLQLYVVPSEWVTGETPKFTKETMNKGELIACSPHCDFRHDSQNTSLKGKCYVIGYREIRGFVKSCSTLHMRGLNPSYNLSDYIVRATVWGDLSMLPIESHDVLLPLLQGASIRLAYTAGWREPHMSPFKGLMQASTQSERQFKEAIALGWKPYHGDKEADLSSLREATKIFRCPVEGGDRDNPIGCSTCALRCDGGRVIIAR